MHKNFLKDKKVLIMGLGRFGGGVDSAKFAASCEADAIVTDTANGEVLGNSIKQLANFNNITYHLSGHREQDFRQADIVIVNPAIPLDNQYVQIARDNGAAISSQIALFFKLCPATIVGITGSNGKSTTTALAAHILQTAAERGTSQYRKAWLSGNIGNEPLLMLLDEIQSDDIVVLELSSFQIEQLAAESLAPHVALITNLLPNHLDRYSSFDRYCAAKEFIFSLQKPRDGAPPISIFNAQDKLTLQWYNKYKEQDDRVCIIFSAEDVPERLKEAFKLPGRANLSNLAAALVVAGCFDIDEDSIYQAVGTFEALPDRLELVIEDNDVRWYNDSKATTPASTIVALQAFDAPITLIAGGYDKNLPFDELATVISQKAKKVILLGQTAKKIRRAIENSCKDSGIKTTPIETVASLEQAVKSAADSAQPGDVVLLSPACASYDMFENYQQRGQLFRQLVRKLARPVIGTYRNPG